MKRIIKLTESDLMKIVRKVIKEQTIGNYIDVLNSATGIDLPSSDIDDRDCLEYNSGKNKMSQLFTYVSKLPTGQMTTQVQKWNDRLYKAMKGLGTGEDYINVLKELKTPNDLAMIYKTFKYEGENLWQWMSGESKYSWDDTFNAVPQSVRNPAKIPLCSKSNPNRYGYSEQYSKNKKKRLNE